MPAGLIKPSLRCAHTEKWALAFTRVRLTHNSKLPCCFCEHVTASRLADHLVVSSVRIRQVFESCSYQGRWMVWCHSFMACSAWWHYGLGRSLLWDHWVLRRLWVCVCRLQPAPLHLPWPLCLPSCTHPCGLGGGEGQEGYLCHYQGYRLCLFLDYSVKSGQRDEKSQPKEVCACQTVLLVLWLWKHRENVKGWAWSSQID